MTLKYIATDNGPENDLRGQSSVCVYGRVRGKHKHRGLSCVPKIQDVQTPAPQTPEYGDQVVLTLSISGTKYLTGVT